jgi:hypothetical protein
VSQCKECTSEFYVEFRKECTRRAHQRNHKLKRRSLKVTEHLGGETVQRRHRRDKIVEDFVELCQVGIERVQGVHKRTLFRVL